MVQAIVDRPNICAFIQYHTMSGVHLRPYGTKNDEGLPTIDLRVFKEIGAKATEITGYPAVSVYHDFRYDPKDSITGVADDWAYDHLGVHAWTTEFWSPMRAAGITDYKFIEWWSDHPLEDDLKMLSWADEVAPGEGYVDWYPYDHPDLGPVELGGWNNQLLIRNPPPHLLARRGRTARRLRHLAPDDLAAAAPARRARWRTWAPERMETATGGCGSSWRTPGGCRPT